MMATMAALLGAVPLVIATGPGSELRRRSWITNVLLLERNKPRDGPVSQSLGIGYSWIGQFQSRSRAPRGWTSATMEVKGRVVRYVQPQYLPLQNAGRGR